MFIVNFELVIAGWEETLQHSFGNFRLFSLFPLEFSSDNILLLADLTLARNIQKRKEEITVCQLI